MKIAVLSITEKGAHLAERIAEAMAQRHAVMRYSYRGIGVPDCMETFSGQRCGMPDGRAGAIRSLPFESTADLMREFFHAYDAWICVCACGIAVRAIAPYIESKQTDPAVVVMDEGGRFAIPVLSGHVGGANALAKRLAEITGAQAAVTTATDTGGRFSPDSFAAANGLIITDFAAAKEIASAVLRGEKIGITSDYPVQNLPKELQETQKLPEELQETQKLPEASEQLQSGRGCESRLTEMNADKRQATGLENEPLPQDCRTSETGLPLPQDCRTGIYIGTDETVCPYQVTLQLIPKNIVLGIGCRRGTTADRISLQVYEALRQFCLRKSGHQEAVSGSDETQPDFAGQLQTTRKTDILMRRISAIATIDRKADEPGLLEYCDRLGVPLVTYTAEQLMAVDNSGTGTAPFASSDFVRETVGADNVCERSAVRCSGGRLVIPKTAAEGVTVAAAERSVVIDGEKELSI